MKSRIARTILGVLCVIGAFWPGALAVSLYIHVIHPGFTTSANSTTFVTVNVVGWRFGSNQVPYLAILSALAAFALFIGGLYLIFFWPREDVRRDARAD